LDCGIRENLARIDFSGLASRNSSGYEKLSIANTHEDGKPRDPGAASTCREQDPLSMGTEDGCTVGLSKLQRYDRFGSAVAVAGNVIVVGAPETDVVSTADSGRVSVFEPTGAGGAWTEVATLVAGLDSAMNLQFGYAVAVDGEIRLRAGTEHVGVVRNATPLARAV
jgi:hypothetical protein